MGPKARGLKAVAKGKKISSLHLPWI